MLKKTSSLDDDDLLPCLIVAMAGAVCTLVIVTAYLLAETFLASR